MSWRERLVDDRGSAVIEFSWLAVFLLVPLIYLVLCLAKLQAGSYAVTQAARESARAFVTASEDGGARARSDAAARIAFADQGFGDSGTLTISCSDAPCLSRGAAVTTRAEVWVPLPLVPAMLRDVVPLEIPVSATQVASVPTYEAR